MKKCLYCKTQFTPNPRVGERQITCGEHACKAALKSDNNRKWRKRNPDYYRDQYPRVKEWLEKEPEYLKKYRESHPEYVEKNLEAQRVRDKGFSILHGSVRFKDPSAGSQPKPIYTGPIYPAYAIRPDR